MATEDRSTTAEGAPPNARLHRRGLLKAAGAAAAAAAIGAGQSRSRNAEAQSAGGILHQSWSEATDLGVHAAATAGGYKTAKAQFTFHAIGSSWDGKNGAWPVVEFRFSLDGSSWTNPIQAPAAVEDGGRPNRDGRVFAELVFVDGANYAQYRILDGSGHVSSVSGFELFFIDASNGPEAGARVAAAALPPLQKPSIISRAGWGCPDPNGATDAYGLIWPTEYQTVEHVILHHSETLNSTDGGDAVRSIYAYHTWDRGWGDIGYNYLVDKDGNIYEGRLGGDNVVGGHAFQYAFGSSGICAVGSFMTVDVTAACENSVIAITAWVARALNPLGKKDFHQVRSCPTICGHRDTNQTSCPGDVYYQDMGYIRQQVANLLNATSHTPPPPPPPNAKFVTGDNVIFLAATRLYTDPSANARLIQTAAKGQYGAIDGAPRTYNGQLWQAVRLDTTTEGYCLVSQIDFAPPGNPPAPIFEVGDQAMLMVDSILRRSPGQAQNAPYNLYAGDLLTVSAPCVAATGTQWVGVDGPGNATGYLRQQDVQLQNPRSISISPTSGVFGTTIKVSVKNFPTSRQTFFSLGGTVARTGVTNWSGAVSSSFAAPDATRGVQPVTARVGVISISANFTYVSSATVAPASGVTGSAATLTAHGFTANETVTAQWLQGSTWQTLGTGAANASGAAAIPIVIPTGATGTITLRASGSAAPTTTYTITGAGGSPSATATPTSTPTPTNTPPAGPFDGAYPLVSSTTCSGAWPSARVRDRNLNSYWRTLNTGVRANAWFFVDLGSALPVGKIGWYMTVTGIAPAFEIQASTDKTTWTKLTSGTDSPAGTWSSYTLPTSVTARYIRFYFTNPTSLPTLGGIGEVTVFPATGGQIAAAAVPTASAANTATPTGTATATATPIGTPVPSASPTGVASATAKTPTATATATATPVPTDTPTNTPTATATATPTATPTDTPTSTSTATATETPTP